MGQFDDAQQSALKYVQTYLSTVNLGLPELDEDAFEAVMNAMTNAMGRAYIAGLTAKAARGPYRRKEK